tara:strand:- start:281 stop:553 length:273 start_codon:yes stop_codon:yes gene_type:complete
MTNKENQITREQEYYKNHFVPELQGYGCISKSDIENELGINLNDKDWNDIQEDLQCEMESFMENHMNDWVFDTLKKIKEERVNTVLVDKE